MGNWIETEDKQGLLYLFLSVEFDLYISHLLRNSILPNSALYLFGVNFVFHSVVYFPFAVIISHFAFWKELAYVYLYNNSQ